MVRTLLISFMIMSSSKALADGNAVAHVAGSAALTTAIYLLFSAATQRKEEAKPFSLGVAIGTGLVYGLALETGDAMGRPDRHLDGGDLLMNGIGVLGAAGLIYSIDF